jgi:hypothetical protein
MAGVRPIYADTSRIESHAAAARLGNEEGFEAKWFERALGLSVEFEFESPKRGRV